MKNFLLTSFFSFFLAIGSIMAQDINIDFTFDPDPDAGEFTMNFTVTGGLPSIDATESYIISGDFSSTGGDVFDGDSFAITLADGATVTIIVSDNDGNTITYTYGPIFAAKCIDGEMVGGPFTVPVGGSANADSSVSNDGDQDVVVYVLHTSSGSSLGTILASNTSGEFTFDDLDGGAYDTTYYISAVIGPDVLDENGNESADGQPDTDSPCYQVLEGSEVLFLAPDDETAPPITIEIIEDCNEDTGQTTLIITILGGTPSEDVNSNYVLSGDINGTFSAADMPISSSPLDDTTTFTVQATDDQGTASVSMTAGPFDCSKLAIELISFDVEETNDGNLLVWQTASEINNAYFNVLKSVDEGRTFEIIATIDGAGDSNSMINYEFEDRSIDCQTAYYQLEQVDFDGSFEFTYVVSISRDGICGGMELSPIPAINEINIEYYSIGESKGVVQLYSITGRLIEEEMIYAREGKNSILFELDNLTAGIYYISLELNGEYSSKKFLKK